MSVCVSVCICVSVCVCINSVSMCARSSFSLMLVQPSCTATTTTPLNHTHLNHTQSPLRGLARAPSRPVVARAHLTRHRPACAGHARHDRTSCTCTQHTEVCRRRCTFTLTLCDHICLLQISTEEMLAHYVKAELAKRKAVCGSAWETTCLIVLLRVINVM